RLDHLGAGLVALTPRKLHALLVDRRSMTEWHMVAVEHVLDLKLPVAVVGVTVHAEVARKGAVGSAINKVVDIVLDRTDLVFETQSRRRQARKNEAAVLLHTRQAREVEIALAKAFGAAFCHRHANQRAVSVEGPAVIQTGQTRRVPTAFVD